MKINEEFIEDIFNNKIELKKDSDKIKLSLFTELIPMYDIYTQRIYPIKKENIYFRLIDSHYRFINYEVKNWIKLNYEKYTKRLTTLKGDEKNQMEGLIERYKMMVKIINNYDIDTLIDTSYKVLYKYSGIGTQISICKRNSFHPFISYLKPYYSKTELVKLGQNMGLVEKTLKPEDLIDEEKHFEICKFISNNDVSIEEINRNTRLIIDNKSISDICFYSFIGATLLNRYLRNKDIFTIDKFYHDRLTNIVKTIKHTPKLDKDYQVYRFISNDEFIKDLGIGDTFVDTGFISTTRDPFYSPGMTGNFGLVLLKINLKKDTPGIGLFMEHFSLFPKEEEFLLPPNTKLKLVSRDDKFKYYHVNSEFEKLINKKYEFDIVSNDFLSIGNISYQSEPVPKMEDNIELLSNNRLDMFLHFKNMTNKYNQINIKGLDFHVLFFDSTGSYKKFYYNNIEKGLSLIHFDENGYPLILIEMGKEMAVNYVNQFYFYSSKKEVSEKLLIEILSELGKIFNYKKIIIYHNYKNFSEFSDNYYENQKPFLYLNLYNDTIYNYIKNDYKPFSFEPFYESKLKDIEIILNKENNRNKLIDCIQKDFNEYIQLKNKLNLDKYNYGILNISDKLIAEGKIDVMLELEYSDEYKKDETFELIFRQPIRRGNEHS